MTAPLQLTGPSPKALGLTAGFNELEPMLVAAYQYLVNNGDTRESELKGYLQQYGYDVPSDFLNFFVSRAGSVIDRKPVGYIRISPAYEASVEDQLPKFRMGKSSEGFLKTENARLKGELTQQTNAANVRDGMLTEARQAREIVDGENRELKKHLGSCHHIKGHLEKDKMELDEQVRVAGEEKAKLESELEKAQNQLDKYRQWRAEDTETKEKLRYDAQNESERAARTQSESDELSSKVKSLIDDLQKRMEASRKDAAEIGKLQQSIVTTMGGWEQCQFRLAEAKNALALHELRRIREIGGRAYQATIRYDSEKDARKADEVERLFKDAGWSASIETFDRSKVRNPSDQWRILMEGGDESFVPKVAKIFNEGNLIGEKIAFVDSYPLVGDAVVIVTIFPRD